MRGEWHREGVCMRGVILAGSGCRGHFVDGVLTAGM